MRLRQYHFHWSVPRPLGSLYILILPSISVTIIQVYNTLYIYHRALHNAFPSAWLRNVVSVRWQVRPFCLTSAKQTTNGTYILSSWKTNIMELQLILWNTTLFIMEYKSTFNYHLCWHMYVNTIQFNVDTFVIDIFLYFRIRK